MNSNAQLIADLTLARDTKQVLELLVTYKGLPVITRCRVTSVELGQVTLVTSDPGLVCLDQGEKVTILGSDYFEPATAVVQRKNLKEKTVVLSDLNYLGTRLGERMIVRVEPKDPLPVLIELEEGNIEGTMVDLSLNGMGIRIDRRQYSPALKPGISLRLEFELPEGPVILVGTLLSTVKIGYQHRISVRFTQSEAYKATIFRYLVDRRSQIERELQADYEQALARQDQPLP